MLRTPLRLLGATAVALVPFWLACGRSSSLEPAEGGSSDAQTLQDDAMRGDDAPQSGEAGDDQDSAQDADGRVLDSATACASPSVSSLPGVSIQFPLQPSTFTLAEAAHGIAFTYDIVVASDVPQVVPDPQGACGLPDSRGLVVHEVLSGNAQHYCVCDQGRCAQSQSQGTVSAGTYRHTMVWDGRNWNGPSDTGNPEGPPFPAGDYTLTVDAKGTVGGQPFEVRSELCFALRGDAATQVDGGCGGTPCTSSQVCVQPACCPACAQLPDSGPCPPGTAVGRCPVGGFMACIAACTPPAPHCADPPALCPADPPCGCLISSECGAAGGTCTGLGAFLQCYACF
jgi:hypothetical protein